MTRESSSSDTRFSREHWGGDLLPSLRRDEGKALRLALV